MDTMRGGFGSLAEADGYDHADDETVRQPAPLSIGQDERRMQVRAYNHWASLLGDRNFPAIEDLEPENLPDFGPYSVLLDFSTGIEDPGIAFVGERLAEECGLGEAELNRLSEVPSLSLLSRITDHYLQIIANQAPIGFEAEFVNQRGATIAYRGILLPYSSDDDTIDFVYGVINWKELADAKTSDELLLEIDQALEARPPRAPLQDVEAPLTDWADGPGTTPANDLTDETGEAPAALDGYDLPADDQDDGLPAPSFGLDDYGARADADEDAELGAPAADDEEAADSDDPESSSPYGSLLKTPINLSHTLSKTPVVLPDIVPQMAEPEIFLEAEEESPTVVELAPPPLDASEMGLGDWLAAAREMAVAASRSEDRTRVALYEAIGRAYDFSLAAAETPAEFEELLGDAGLTMQDRAPMTPVVKLVFGADYDKTRLTEYAAALSHAHRLGLPQGALGEFLGEAEGGLKGVVKAERRFRREESGKVVEPADAPRRALAKKLRALPPQPFEAIALEGSEFALVMIRRSDAGEVAMLGEVPDDVALVERAARRLLG